MCVLGSSNDGCSIISSISRSHLSPKNFHKIPHSSPVRDYRDLEAEP